MAENNTQIQEQNAPAQNAPATPQKAPNYDEIFSKLDAILDKRADGLAKSALKDNGVEESEIADIVKAYREQKQSKAAEQNNALAAAQQKISSLQKQITDRDISDAFATAALDAGINARALPYITRLADKEGVLGENGKPDDGKVKEAIAKVLEDVPALKASANDNKGFVPTAPKSGETTDDDADKKLRRYFGL